MSRKNILVVDDEKSQREILEMILAEEGYDVTTAASGEAALKIAKERRFDLVLTDLKMTGMDGIELLQRLLAYDSSIIVILLTAHGSIDSAKEALRRAAEMFQAVNCAAINENLLESELFGHEKGSFTGAHAEKKGLFEVADRGTLFLDEIGELDISMQAKLLRALQEREIRRVGGTRPIKIDVRVVCATNRDLRAMVQDGRFRDDLYYRINVLSIDVPPLRERREDIPVLLNFFLKKHMRNTARLVRGFTPEARAVLLEYAWPGNVRQLESAVERAILLCENDQITVE